ncbi:MAG: hypothetical protein ACLP8S_33550 [Solirubrobacteraceae bacterium]
MNQLPDPPSIQALHQEIQRRHGILDPLAVLKNADHLCDFTAPFTTLTDITPLEPPPISGSHRLTRAAA